MIKIPEYILDLSPYKAGKPIEELAREKGLKKIVKLASNENPLGPSAMAVEAIKKNLTDLHRYTDPKAFKLVNALAEKHNRKPEEIFVASGSDAILQYIISAFCDDEDELLTSEGSFIGWYVNAKKYNKKLRTLPLKEYSIDLNAVLNSINDKTKIIYLANPNNPTGTIFNKESFELFVSNVPGNILIVLDEAYTVYAKSFAEYPNGLDYTNENLIVLRTLSKAYGLAGIRIGYALGKPELITNLFKVKLPFEPNILAQVAAIAALHDEGYISRTVELNKTSLEMMKEKFCTLGIKYVPTFANFYLLLFPDETFALEFNNKCLDKGLILRYLSSFGIPNGVRINSGTIGETNFALEVIENVYNELTNTK